MNNIVIEHPSSAPQAKSVFGNPRPKILYPALIVAAFSVTLLSLTGVAALTGYLPGANAKQGAAQGTVANEVGRDNQANGSDKLALADCANCGTVESVRVVEHKGSGSGLGAVAGGVVGGLLGNQIGHGGGRTLMTLAGAGGGAYAGNEIEKNVKKSSAYQIRVRMADGSIRTLTQHEAPNVNSGDRVRIANGAITQVL